MSRNPCRVHSANSMSSVNLFVVRFASTLKLEAKGGYVEAGSQALPCGLSLHWCCLLGRAPPPPVAMPPSTSNITVVVRVRPLSQKEVTRGAFPTLEVHDGWKIDVMDPDDKMGGLDYLRMVLATLLTPHTASPQALASASASASVSASAAAAAVASASASASAHPHAPPPPARTRTRTGATPSTTRWTRASHSRRHSSRPLATCCRTSCRLGLGLG